jgi:hypothetical protein
MFAVAAGLCASTSSFAQLGLPKLGGTNTSAQAGVDASASQDQLVTTYVAASSETMLGQSKMADALGLKDQAAELAAKAEALKSCSTKDCISDSTTVSEGDQKKIDEAQAKSTDVTDAAKATFSDGLKHYGLGLAGTVALKNSAMNFQQSAQAQITSASLLDKMSVTKKLAVGTYVATNLPGHIANLGSGLKSAVSFAQSHGIPVPTDATAALSGL